MYIFENDNWVDFMFVILLHLWSNCAHKYSSVLSYFWSTHFAYMYLNGRFQYRNMISLSKVYLMIPNSKNIERHPNYTRKFLQHHLRCVWWKSDFARLWANWQQKKNVVQSIEYRMIAYRIDDDIFRFKNSRIKSSSCNIIAKTAIHIDHHLFGVVPIRKFNSYISFYFKDENCEITPLFPMPMFLNFKFFSWIKVVERVPFIRTLKLWKNKSFSI